MMSLPKKGLRRITINGVNYEWMIRKRATSGVFYHKKKLKPAVQLQTASKKGLLVIDFGVSPPGNETNPHKTSVTPKTMELAIKSAIDKGWNPTENRTFELSFPLTYIPAPENLSPNAEFDIRWDEEDI